MNLFWTLSGRQHYAVETLVKLLKKIPAKGLIFRKAASLVISAINYLTGNFHGSWQRFSYIFVHFSEHLFFLISILALFIKTLQIKLSYLHLRIEAFPDEKILDYLRNRSVTNNTLNSQLVDVSFMETRVQIFQKVVF